MRWRPGPANVLGLMRWSSPPPAPRHARMKTGPGLASCLIGMLVVLSWNGGALAGPREEQPRLILPGSHAVRAGQWVYLQWAEADSILELEILLSLDGRQYSVCISPQLDPKRCGFIWRVPRLTAGALRMRIRFNREGREIEGAPTAPLLVLDREERHAEPLGLPPVDGAAERAPRPSGGRGEAPAGRSASASLQVDETAPPRQMCSRRETSAADRSILRPPGATLSAAFSAPRSVPLRA